MTTALPSYTMSGDVTGGIMPNHQKGEIMVGNTEHITRLISDRSAAYPLLAIVNVIGMIANLWIILAHGAAASTPAKFAIFLSIVAVALLSSLPARSLFADIAALREDMADESQTAYGRELASKPIPLFAGLTIGFNALVAIVQTWALFSQ